MVSSTSRLALGSTGLDEQDITVFNNVVLALGHNLTSSLDSTFIAKLLKEREVIHNGLNESLLKVSVDDTSGSRGLDALADRPLADLVGTGSEEAGQIQGLTHGGDNLGQTGLGAQLLALLGGRRIVAHQGQTLLEAGRDGKDGAVGRVGLDPLEQRGQVLVLLADVVLLAQVDQVHNGLGSEQEQGVDNLDLKPLLSAVMLITVLSVFQKERTPKNSV